MILDILLTFLSFICILGGLAGCILPVIPGPPLSYLGLLLFHWTNWGNYSHTFLVIMAIIAVFITILDYYIPIWGTKKLGGSKSGITGSTIGLIIGIFLPPVGFVVGPFLGAIAGELLNGKDNKTAIKSGIGSFLGILAGTGLKLTFAFIVIYYFVKEIINSI